MMNNLKKFKMPIIIVVVLIVVFIIYSYFKGGNSDNSNAVLTQTTASGAPVGSGSDAVGQAFLNQLLTLQSVRLDDSVFTDPRFQSLVDNNQPIPDVPQGRPNPFAPIGVDQVNSATFNSSGNGLGFTFDSATSSKTTSTSTKGTNK